MKGIRTLSRNEEKTIKVQDGVNLNITCRNCMFVGHFPFLVEENDFLEL